MLLVQVADLLRQAWELTNGVEIVRCECCRSLCPVHPSLVLGSSVCQLLGRACGVCWTAGVAIDFDIRILTTGDFVYAGIGKRLECVPSEGGSFALSFWEADGIF